jgi:hypothetical protein
MQYKIILNDLPAGLICRVEDNKIYTKSKGFASSDNKEVFEKMEGFITSILNELQIELTPVNDFLAVIERDRTTSIYVDELEVKVTVQLKNNDGIKVGENLPNDNIVDIRKVIIEGISIPDNAGFIFLSRLQRGGGCYVIVYDFIPVMPHNLKSRDYDIEKELGEIYSYLLFQHLYEIVDDEWDKFFDKQWFPFISLGETTVKNMLGKIRNGSCINSLTEEIATKVKDEIEYIKRRLQSNLSINDHFPLIEHGINKFLEEDYISSICIIYTQIEGIMKTSHFRANSSISLNKNLSQKDLVTSTIKGSEDQDTKRDLLLPDRFETYLNNVYFKGFKRESVGLVQSLSRHTLSHGVAAPKLYDLKGAVLGILILDQLSFYIQ